MISQLVKVDGATWRKITAARRSSLLEIEREWDLRVLRFDPQLFTHVYLELGRNPGRLGCDLTYYLATVQAFFHRNGGVHPLRLSGLATDVKKRLSEDLAVAISALFMNRCFGVDWRSMAHIPVNNKLSRKRPDFEGFCAEERHLWESKGVSSPARVAAALGQALEQVKDYPKPSASKLGIVSYFPSDGRLFESSTFVVGSEVPDVVPPDRMTAQLLHVEYVLDFAGLPKTASVYMKALAKYLKAQGQEGNAEFRYRGVPYARDLSTRIALEDESRRLEEREVRGRKYRGRRVSGRVDGEEVALWLGVRCDLLNTITSIPALARFVDENDAATFVGDGISVLSDATVLIQEREARRAHSLSITEGCAPG